MLYKKDIQLYLLVLALKDCPRNKDIKMTNVAELICMAILCSYHGSNDQAL